MRHHQFNFFQASLVFVLLCLCIGCSTTKTTAHLNTRYLSETKELEIKNALKETEFNVAINRHEFPKEITKNSLIYSPFLIDQEGLDQILQVLERQGYSIADIDMLTSGNHWYTKQSIGIYLIPEGKIINEGQGEEDFIAEYSNLACGKGQEEGDGKQQSLRLEAHNKAILITKANHIYKGRWSLTSYPYIEVIFHQPYTYVYYEIVKPDKRSEKTDRTVLRLMNNSDLLNCDLIRR